LIWIKAPVPALGYLAPVMSSKIVTLDVRDDIRNGREPFGKIMQAVGALKGNERLRLLTPFEPAPLYRVLAQRGFSHQTTAQKSGDYEVLFSPAADGEALHPEPAPAEPSASPRRACAGTPVVEVDARGLEPPEPLTKVLEALAALPAGAELRARTDRRPLHLYARIEERGFAAESQEQADGTFLTRICKRSP
jgi:uncharacterized protein (DUF2249 family)